MVAVIVVILALQNHVSLSKEIKSLLQNSHKISDTFLIVKASTSIRTSNK